MRAPTNTSKKAIKEKRVPIELWLALASPYMAEICAVPGTTGCSSTENTAPTISPFCSRNCRRSRRRFGNFSAELSNQSRSIRDRLATIYAAWARAIEICVREAQQAGQLRVEADPATVAAFLVNAWEGAVLRAKVDRDGRAFDQFDDVVFAGLFV
jgi:hypothetical protein